MANELMVIPFNDIRQMAEAVAKGGLFGVKTTDQALSLMLLAQSENMHPMRAIMEFDLIQGKPARKSWSMLDRFLTAGGTVKWHERTDAKASATFSHPAGGTITVDWDMPRASKAGLTGKDNWKKFPRAMLSARCVSEGVRAIYPGATGGLYETEEVRDMVDVTPPAPKPAKAANGKTAPHDPETGEVLESEPVSTDMNFGLPIGWPGDNAEAADWLAAGEQAKNEIGTLQRLEDVARWEELNAPGMERCMRLYNKLYQRLGEVLLDRKEALANG